MYRKYKSKNDVETKIRKTDFLLLWFYNMIYLIIINIQKELFLDVSKILYVELYKKFYPKIAQNKV